MSNLNHNIFKYLCTIGTAILMSSAAYAQKISSDELLKQALLETNEKQNYEAAIKLAKQGLEVSPNYLDIEILLGRLYLLTRKYEEAVVTLKRVLAKHPNQTDALQYMINANYQNKGLAQAAAYCSQFLNYYPNDKKIWIKRIAILSEMQSFNAANNDMKLALKRFPKDADLAYLHKDLLFAQASKALIEKDTLSALKTYSELLSAYQTDTIARNQVINLQTQRKNYTAALKHIDTALNNDQDKETLLLKKIEVTQLMGNAHEAYQISKTAAASIPESKKIKLINDELFLLSRQNQIGINYAFTAISPSSQQRWNVYGLSYIRSEEFGTLVGRVNYADRNNVTGYQFEIEAYPTHHKSYSYINMAYANAIVFPKFRFSYSYFLPFKTWETEVGLRYLNNVEDNFLGFTAALGKYFGPYWLNLKTFVTPNDKKLANSYVLSGRYYLNGSSDDYFTVIAGYGFSPDDRGRNFEIDNRLNMEAIRFTIGYQRTLWRTNVLGIFGTYNNQKYEQNIKRNEYEAAIAFRHKF